MIYIFSDKVHSGKTSRLSAWIKNLNNVDGILAPVIDGKRKLLAIKSNETRQLEVLRETSEMKLIKVGKYLFDEEVFNWGREILVKASNSEIEWLIIDEVGILELNDRGLEPAISKILDSSGLRPSLKIVLVVRDSLVEDVIEKYKLNKEKIEFLKL